MRYPNIKNFKYITKVYGFNLSDVDISGVSFSDCDLRPIKFRKDRNLFQKIRKKDISFAVMPIMDYSNYNFKNVCIKGTKFPSNAVLPNDYQFFQKIKYKDCRGTTLPIETQKSLHLYNLKGVRINLSDYDLTPEQIYIIHKKLED